MLRQFLTIFIWLGLAGMSLAQDLQPVLQTHADEIAKPSRSSVSVALDDLVASGAPKTSDFLEQWQDKGVWQRDADGVFFFATEDGDALTWRDIDTAAETTAPKAGFSQLKPNGGVRRLIGTALVQFQLTDPDLARRTSAIESIARRPNASQLAPLLKSIDPETDATLKARKIQLANFMSASFAPDTGDKIAAINSMSSDTSIEARAVLNQLLSVKAVVSPDAPKGNVARVLKLGPDLSQDDAYAQLVAAKLAPPTVSPAAIRDALTANIDGGRVGGIPTAQLDNQPMRETAYTALAGQGIVPPLVTQDEQTSAVEAHSFYEVYDEKDPAVTDAARAALDSIETRVGAAQAVDLTLDALSLASIYFLAAIGLAITFGVMGVINMAHGEFIMMGAYTGYVVQQFVPDYTLS
ncbi:MAG: urea transport system permease protein, partial [Akkermansiaceae bacterium]